MKGKDSNKSQASVTYVSGISGRPRSDHLRKSPPKAKASGRQVSLNLFSKLGPSYFFPTSYGTISPDLAYDSGRHRLNLNLLAQLNILDVVALAYERRLPPAAVFSPIDHFLFTVSHKVPDIDSLRSPLSSLYGHIGNGRL